MADTVRPDPFSSVYVLDAHFQYKDGVVDVFNSPAGRAVISNCSPAKMRSPVFKTSKRSANTDVTKFLLGQDNFDNGNNCVSAVKFEEKVVIFEEDESRSKIQQNDCWQSPDLQDRLSQGDSKCDESRNNNVGLTRRIVTFKNEDVDRGATVVEEDDEDARINEKILRLKNHYERGFVADEKCDILKRMLTGFLSGWIFAKSSSSGGKWRKRKSSDDLYREASMALGIPCEMTDSCRCLDCQCNYFDCGDSDSDTSEMSINMNECDVEEWPCAEINPTEKAFDVFYYEDEVKKKTETTTCCDVTSSKEEDGDAATAAPATAGDANSGAPAAICQDGAELAPTLEMAAGTPVLLDHLLNTPLTCTLQ
ncbi:uncharacterized protein LOC143913454 [Arctopsyche grandis]|uniref:uncharacterized protein LOC143913454 n=1 Tax=Arctopsyche grandis TaxID=121162 RepID=UPI00406DA30C